MRNFVFSIPENVSHLFYNVSDHVTYEDKLLTKAISSTPEASIMNIITMIPDDLKVVELRKFNSSDNGYNTIDLLNLWPLPNMKKAEVIIDGQAGIMFPLYNNKEKSFFSENLKNLTWKESILISYTKENREKIGFFLFS